MKKNRRGVSKKLRRIWGCNKTNQEFNTSVRTIIIIAGAASCEKTSEGAYYPNVNCGSRGLLQKKSKTCTKTYLTFFIKAIKGR